jgi:hypothetical protein
MVARLMGSSSALACSRSSAEPLKSDAMRVSLASSARRASSRSCEVARSVAASAASLWRDAALNGACMAVPLVCDTDAVQ